MNLLPRLNPPQFALDLVFGEPLELRDAFSGARHRSSIVNGIDTGYHDGYYHQFSAGVQQELLPDLLLEASYVGARGRDLPLFLIRTRVRREARRCAIRPLDPRPSHTRSADRITIRCRCASSGDSSAGCRS